jgi:hypothetical protein
VSEGSAAWSLLQLTELLRAGDGLLRSGLQVLDGIEGELENGDAVVLSHCDLVGLRELGEALTELASRVQSLIDQLPREAVEVTAAALARGALEDLASGVIDPSRARLAARVAPVGPGWRALAHALRTTDAHAAWDDVAAEELLGSFRGVERTLVRRVLAAARLPAGETFAAYGTPDVARLAAALEEHAPDP